MLTGDFREARECRVEVVDFSKGAIEKFLEFLYTDHVQDWGGCEMELLQLADKYMVPELRDECSLRLWTCDAPRALEVLRAAGLCELISRPLRRRLTAVVVFNMDSLVGTKEWAEFQATYPVLADSMLGSSDSSRKSDSTTSVWALQ
ncbi:BTB and MATH domain-containing protein 40-like [Frankliniella occidentalis]|uniref:BTB and MATH domain-containing protein 40-like n=1 Tax=Frankliniella occidentalis TaxID=133901 RepID=A0A6J1TD43_FRAOC|nr:BTB and MATH domain-containing protein 40-like [Frankliniella occidentalis]